MKRGFAIALILAVCSAFAGAATTKEEMQATGEAWLALIDHEQYGESWNQASNAFRVQVSAEKWTAAMKAAREPFGEVVSRKLLGVNFAKALPGAPDGEYAVLQFHTSFAKKADSTETVTFALEDGKWKSAGFFIR